MSEIVEGRPVRFGQRELVPVVRVESIVQRQALVSDKGLMGGGLGFVHLKPIAVLERCDGEEGRRIRIPGGTAQLIGISLLIGLAIPLLILMVVRVARR
jgi:hypothetical protein